ncbi:MAG: arsenate reductase, partial [Flavobacteriaceae bacterium]|nr:arsenate reductase [Flavobacteriaceae bacterium]NNK60950.1 arsenate reductase [Flavobacteriaceae bacterium]
IEYLKETPTREELKNIIDLLEINPLELVRKNEQVWKDNYKGKDLSDEAIVEALLTHPKLIERPIVINNNNAVIGRPPDVIKTII